MNNSIVPNTVGQLNGVGNPAYMQSSVSASPRPEPKSTRSATWNGSPTHPDRHFHEFLGSTRASVSQPEHQSCYNNGNTEYRYDRLGERDEIRLLKLFPSWESYDEITAELVPVKFGIERPPYVALSYCWGNDPPQKYIKVNDSVLAVRHNLHDFLQTLRSTDSPKYLWIDALCINQNDSREKSEQVRLMGEIYSKAETVAVWLGSESEDGKIALPFLSELLNLRHFDELVEREVEKWKAVDELLRNKWFSRCWVLQGVALAKNATLHWGRETIQWDDFADAISILGAQVDHVTNLKRNVAFLSTDWARRALPATSFMDATRSIFKKAGNGDIIERLCSLELLVSSTVKFEADDPRDKIYAMLSLAGDHDPPLVANYNRDYLDVYSDFVEHCINTSRSLDIICRHWAHIPPRKKIRLRESHADTLPSWIPSVLGSPFATFEDVNSNDRLYGDSFVGLPDRKSYNASLGEEVEGLIRIKRITETNDWGSQTNRVLTVRGLEISKVRYVGERAFNGIIPSEWLEMGGWIPASASSDYDLSRVPEKLWRTLVADRGTDGIKAPSWYRRACSHCLDMRPTQDPDINTERMLRSGQTPSPVAIFLKRVQSVIWNRKFFTTTGMDGEETFGLAPAQSKAGDIICILFGCSVPVLLRKIDTVYYKLIGEIYLHEMMDGQALVGKTTEELLRLRKTFSLL